MLKQPYSCQLKVLGGVGWDKKKFLESNQHVYGRDDAKNYSIQHGKVAKKKEKEKKKEITVTNLLALVTLIINQTL